MDAPKSLTTVILDGKEICRRMNTFSTLKDIIESCRDALPCKADLSRSLKFCSEFLEYIDVNVDSPVENLDKFQILFKTIQTDIGDVSANMQETGVPQETGMSQEMGIPQISTATNDLDPENVKIHLQQKDPRILAFYEENGTLTEKWRRALVTAAVSFLVEKKGFYPVSADKTLLARGIVALFPSLNIKMEEENEGYEHFYDPSSHTGFLEDKLRNIRRKLTDDQRRYRKRGSLKSSQVTVTLEEITVESDASAQEWITVIKRMKPSPENISSIKMGMDKTFSHRRYWISSQSPTLAEIFECYPRFVDMPYLIDREFDRMFPEKGDVFLRKWEPSMVPKLLKLAALERDESAECAESAESKCFRALKMLTHYLPPTVSGRTKGWTKCSVKSALAYMLDIKPPGTHFNDLLQTADPAPALQPRLVSLGHPSTSAAQFVIVAPNDKVVVPLQDEGLTCSMDKLFKLYWVCNLAYPVQLVSVFGFMEHIYGLQISSGKRCKIVELVAKLQVL